MSLILRRRCRLLGMLCSYFVVLTVSVQQLATASSSVTKRVVTTLPGFRGRLPFHLKTGYVEVDRDYGAELFYYFIESEASGGGAGATNEIPFLLWLTGGNRCSVLSGLAVEIGPIRFVLEPYNGTLPRLRYHPYSWTRVSHILFVDSPVGAGFSFSRHSTGYEVGDVSSSEQLHEFLIKWFTDHPEYLANPFYIGGDSYAGKLAPFLAHKISEGIEARRTPLLNLKGYLVGNPMTGESIDTTSRVPYAHGAGIISDQLYETIMEHCKGEDYANPGSVLCARALDTCNSLLDEVMLAQILADNCVLVHPGPNEASNMILTEETSRLGKLNNPPPRPPFTCTAYSYYLSYFWANDRSTRDALGIKEGSVDEWVRCHSGDMATDYSIDLKSSIDYHRKVTSKGYRALVYSGDHDAVAPHLGTQAWVRSLNFSVVDEWRAWHLGDQSAGFTIGYSNNMTFATVKGAGHTAPEFEPERCFAMFQRWILNRPL